MLKAFTIRQITIKLMDMKTFVPLRIVRYGKEGQEVPNGGTLRIYLQRAEKFVIRISR